MVVQRLLSVLLILVSGTAFAQPISRVIPDDVEVITNIVYASYTDRELMLDLYRPQNSTTELFPTIVVIRGGGWRAGDKEGFGPMAAALAQRGFTAVSIEYRASGEASFPAAVYDTKAAVRWLRNNAARYQLDPNAIGAIGGSAGAHLAAYLGVTADVVELEGNGGSEDASSHISAIVGFATPTELVGPNAALEQFLGEPYVDDPDLWEFASPISHVTDSAPPILLGHSQDDNVVDFDQSLLLAKKYSDVGVEVELYLFPGAPHAFWNSQEWFNDSMDRAAEFFNRHLGQ